MAIHGSQGNPWESRQSMGVKAIHGSQGNPWDFVFEDFFQDLFLHLTGEGSLVHSLGKSLKFVYYTF